MSDTRDIPAVSLRCGSQLPMIGFGTWPLRGHPAHAAVSAALAAGYRHIDTATMYGNEAEVGRALADSDVSRDEVFLTTKLRPSDAGHERSILRKSLRSLGTEYVDLWLVHWPPPRPQLRRQVWNEMLGIRAEGLVREIGVSNYTLGQIDDLIADSGEAPAVNQIHWNPQRYDAQFLAGHRARGSAAASDAYFPFPDGLLVLAEAGVSAVAEPGGSVRDGEVIEAASAARISLYFTGVRHFLH